MKLLRPVLSLLFLPGNLVLHSLGISVEEDSGVLRSFVNSCFWGLIALLIALQCFT